MKRILLLPLGSALLIWNCQGHTAAQDSPSSAPKPSAASPDATYPDSVEGMQAQMDDMIRLVRMPDQAPFIACLDALAIPQPRDWMAANFSPSAAPQAEQDYAKSFPGFRSHVWWVMGNFARSSDFGLKVLPSQLPEVASTSGLEALLPKPNTSIKIENFRFSPTGSNPPSWVSSFVYIDGRFRFVGGTYPFWNEKLTSLRGPMAISAQHVGNLTVQGVPFGVDPATPGVVAVVVMDVEIGPDGKAYGFHVKSGDRSYVKRAQKYVKDWQFFRLPTHYE
jgi:hypothetical protein